MKIPPEVDALMWEVAEAGSVELMDQFGRRYPEYRSELVQRIQLVRGLKGARPGEAPKPKAASFQPSATISGPHWKSRVLPVAIGALVLFSVSFATYSVVEFRKSSTKSVVEQSLPNKKPPEAPPWAVEPKINTGTTFDQQPEIPQQIPPPPVQEPESPFDRPINVNTQRSKLSDVLLQIASQAGLSINSAPNMDDPDVMAFYPGTTALEALKDLGRHCGFTALPQGRREVLLIPAVDRNQPQPESPAGSYANTFEQGDADSGRPRSSTGNNPSLSGPIGR